MVGVPDEHDKHVQQTLRHSSDTAALFPAYAWQRFLLFSYIQASLASLSCWSSATAVMSGLHARACWDCLSNARSCSHRPKVMHVWSSIFGDGLWPSGISAQPRGRQGAGWCVPCWACHPGRGISAYPSWYPVSPLVYLLRGCTQSDCVLCNAQRLCRILSVVLSVRPCPPSREPEGTLGHVEVVEPLMDMAKPAVEMRTALPCFQGILLVNSAVMPYWAESRKKGAVCCAVCVVR